MTRLCNLARARARGGGGGGGMGCVGGSGPDTASLYLAAAQDMQLVP